MTQQNDPSAADQSPYGWNAGQQSAPQAPGDPTTPGQPWSQGQLGGYASTAHASTAHASTAHGSSGYGSSGYGASGYGSTGYPAGGHGLPGGGFYAPRRKTNGLALASMIVSICSLVMCPFVGIVGAILGHKGRAQARDLNEDGDGFALAGIIVGWIGFGLGMLVVAFYVVAFIVLANTGGFDSPSPTLN